MKKCRICGRISDNIQRCPVCQTDLSSLPDWKEEEFKISSSDEKVKKCQCGEINNEDAQVCKKCAKLLTNTLAVRKWPERPQLSLRLLDGRRIIIPYSGGLLGRSSLGCTELHMDKYISNYHLEIMAHRNQYLAQSLSSTNSTFYNARKLKDGEQILLKRKDVLRIGITDLQVEFSSSFEVRKRIQLL